MAPNGALLGGYLPEPEPEPEPKPELQPINFQLWMQNP